MAKRPARQITEGWGFNATDAYLLTSFAQQVIESRELRAKGLLKHRTLLSPKQLAITRAKIKKYIRQLLEIAHEKEAERMVQSAVDAAEEAKAPTAPAEGGATRDVFHAEPCPDRRSALVVEGQNIRWKTPEEMLATFGGLDLTRGRA